MGLLVSVLVVLLAAFVVGSLARFAVPGPDPMPVWLTIAIGLAGAVVGAVGFAVLGLVLGRAADAPAPAPDAADEGLAASAFLLLFLVAVIGATILLVLYRKLIQKRPLTGPKAHRPPLKPRGLRRILTRQPHRYLEETADPEAGWAPEQLRKLVLLKEAGEIDEAEYERRKAALIARL